MPSTRCLGTQNRKSVCIIYSQSQLEKKFSSPSSSIHTLGLIAIAKLLSPSHAQHSISLYNDYTYWMASNGVNGECFRGFIANRFGRVAELAQEYLKWREAIQAFFDAVVDINSNKLVLAVSTFIQNDWFTCCTEIYSMMGEHMIFPMMRLLGIDKKGDDKDERRNWPVQESKHSLRASSLN